jgi:GTP cyclohydrolase II
MTSEVFGSLKCDCKAQLEAALRHIQAEGRGLVCYLRQEGRGIGLGIAQGFAKAGAELFLIADDPAVSDRAKEIGATGVAADILDGAA